MTGKPVKSIAILVGSLRRESFSRKIAKIILEKLGDEPYGMIVDIGNLPLYNEDIEQDAPKAYQEFRDAISASSGVLFVTPEYNRSIPGALKNAIDVGSRPMKSSVWTGKPAAIVSISRGALGGFGASHHLRQSLVGVNAATLPQPEIYIGGIAGLLDEAGHLNNSATDALLDGLLGKFSAWIDLLGKPV